MRPPARARPFGGNCDPNHPDRHPIYADQGADRLAWLPRPDTSYRWLVKRRTDLYGDRMGERATSDSEKQIMNSPTPYPMNPQRPQASSPCFR